MALLQCLHDDDAANALIERLAWPDGPVCPHCRATARVRRLRGATAPGTWKCYDCRRIFSLRSVTAFHSSHLPLHVSLQAVYLLAASRAEVTAGSLAKVLGVSLRTGCVLKQRAKRMMPWLSRQIVERAPDWSDIARLTQPARWQEQEQPQPTCRWGCERRFERFKHALAATGRESADAAFLLLLRAILAQRQDVEARQAQDTKPPADGVGQREGDLGAAARSEFQTAALPGRLQSRQAAQL